MFADMLSGWKAALLGRGGNVAVLKECGTGASQGMGTTETTRDWIVLKLRVVLYELGRLAPGPRAPGGCRLQCSPPGRR